MKDNLFLAMNSKDIKKALIDVDSSQSEIAEELGVDRSYVNRVLNRQYTHKGEKSNLVRKAIARKIGKSTEEVWGDN